ncbi:MAG: deoxyribose-phosphate aldolase [Wenzhouxiangellaceae bacterium]|nr:MAG: deoxyribose-phosphate aldolase [Wenzhouxiangellaceae bacterium]
MLAALSQKETARLALSLLDLTSLNETDTEDDILRLCQRANTASAHVAAVCVWPRHVAVACRALVEQSLQGKIKVATVINFPEGTAAADQVLAELAAALASGADEIDLVFPYRALIAGDALTGKQLVERVRRGLEGRCLKVILETGELGDERLIRFASQIAIDAGADFLKTSTGKVKCNATLAAARVMLEAIRDSGRQVGFKAAGGIRTTADAAAYLDLAADILGPEWTRPECFRFGASSLLDELLRTLGEEAGSAPMGGSY